jgi:hypothetical protein
MVDAVNSSLLKLAGTSAVSTALLTKVVERAVPFQFTTEPEMKFEPTTLKVNSALPESLLLGEIATRLGAAFCGGGGPELPPPHPTFVISKNITAASRTTRPNHFRS